jgi:hypothetical protein
LPQGKWNFRFSGWTCYGLSILFSKEVHMNVVQVNPSQAVWLRVAAVLYALSVSWPVHLPTLQYVRREGELPLVHVFGQTFHGLDGPIMHFWGPNAIIASIFAFGVASAFEVLAGYWLWKRQGRGVTLAVALLPIYWFFAIGWAVPYMWLIGALKVIALAFGWKSVR